MKIYNSYYLLFFSILITACCGSEFSVEEFCEDQVFTESKTVPIDFTYVVNKKEKILEAHKLTGADIQKSIGATGTNFKIKRLELTSASVQYKKGSDNYALGLVTSLAVVDNTLLLVPLLKKDLYLPMNDLPSTGFTPALNINKELNENGVKELKKLFYQYFDLLNDEGISFVLVGTGSPTGVNVNFELKVKMWVALTYEVCRYVPVGQGERVCK